MNFLRLKAVLVNQGISPENIEPGLNIRTLRLANPIFCLTQLLVVIEDEFSVSFSDDEADSINTVQDVIDLLGAISA